MFVDIHCHVLPGVDDGPASIQETIALLKKAHQHGTRWVAATPHLFHEAFGNRDTAKMREHFQQTQSRLIRLATRSGHEFLKEIRLFPGAENCVGLPFLEALERRDLQTLNDSRYLLVEFPLSLPGRHFLPTLRRILNAGYVPVIAHIERYRALHDDADLIRTALEDGCLTQINASSLNGRFWEGGRGTVWRWLKQDLVSVVASDGHNSVQRSPALDEAHEKAVARFSAEEAEAWFVSNPRWILSAPRMEESDGKDQD